MSQIPHLMTGQDNTHYVFSRINIVDKNQESKKLKSLFLLTPLRFKPEVSYQESMHLVIRASLFN